MTILDVVRQPGGQYDIHLRLTEADALDLAKRIVACAEKSTELNSSEPAPIETPPKNGEETE